MQIVAMPFISGICTRDHENCSWAWVYLRSFQVRQRQTRIFLLGQLPFTVIIHRNGIVNANVLRRREWREHQWREHEWREHHWRDYPDQD
jgi:hypothetical protein